MKILLNKNLKILYAIVILNQKKIIETFKDKKCPKGKILESKCTGGKIKVGAHKNKECKNYKTFLKNLNSTKQNKYCKDREKDSECKLIQTCVKPKKKFKDKKCGKGKILESKCTGGKVKIGGHTGKKCKNYKKFLKNMTSTQQNKWCKDREKDSECKLVQTCVTPKICDHRRCAEDICKRANAAKYSKDTYSEFIKNNIDLSKIIYEKDKYNRILGCQYCTNKDKNKIHQYVTTNSSPAPTKVWVDSDLPYKNGERKKWTDGYWADGALPTFQDLKFHCNDGGWKFYKSLEDCKSGKTCVKYKIADQQTINSWCKKNKKRKCKLGQPVIDEWGSKVEISDSQCNKNKGKCNNPENCVIRGKQIQKILPKEINTCVSNANIKDKNSNEKDMRVSANRGYFKCRSPGSKYGPKHEESCHRKICETVIGWNEQQKKEKDKIFALDFYEHIKNNNNDLTKFYKNCQDCIKETFVWEDSCDYFKKGKNKKKYSLYKNRDDPEQLERIRNNLNKLFPLTNNIQNTSKNTPKNKEIKKKSTKKTAESGNATTKLCKKLNECVTHLQENLSELPAKDKFDTLLKSEEAKDYLGPCVNCLDNDSLNSIKTKLY